MAQPPEGQRCETCAFYIDGTCRHKSPEQLPVALGKGMSGWLPCPTTGWCFNWKADPSPAP